MAAEAIRVVELASFGARLERPLGTYRVEQLSAFADRPLVLAEKPVYTLPAAEIRRLLAWASYAPSPT